jgi:hypothetical protein
MTAAQPPDNQPLPKRGRGRPRTGKAVPNKERQDAHRARLKQSGKVRVELIVSTAVCDQLGELQRWTGLSRDEAAELAISEKHRRLAAAPNVKKVPRRRD